METYGVRGNDRLRVTVDYDLGLSESPINDMFAMSEYSLVYFGGFRFGELCIEGRLLESNTVETINQYSYVEEEFFDAIKLHCRRNDLAYYEVETCGYSQGEYRHYLLVLDRQDSWLGGLTADEIDNTLRGITDEYNAWLWGDIYLVGLQELVTWQKLGGSDDETMGTWETKEMIGGIYYDSTSELSLIVRHEFGVELGEVIR